jgi:hypothetical protein
MFRLVRWLFSLALFAGLVWFATTVKLGKRTLWGHLAAIFSTREARDLADGTRDEAQKIARRLRGESPDLGARHVGAPLDPVEERDRRGLDRLVREKTHTRHAEPQ